MDAEARQQAESELLMICNQFGTPEEDQSCPFALQSSTSVPPFTPCCREDDSVQPRCPLRQYIISSTPPLPSHLVVGMTMVRSPKAMSMEPVNETWPMPPPYGPRRLTSRRSMICMALTCSDRREEGEEGWRVA